MMSTRVWLAFACVRLLKYPRNLVLHLSRIINLLVQDESTAGSVMKDDGDVGGERGHVGTN